MDWALQKFCLTIDRFDEYGKLANCCCLYKQPQEPNTYGFTDDVCLLWIRILSHEYSYLSLEYTFLSYEYLPCVN